MGTPTTPIGKPLKTITDFLDGNKITLTNLALAGITVGLDILLEDELFDCPKEGFSTYGYMFLIAPCFILLLANMMAIVTVWDPREICSELAEKKNKKKEHCFKETLPSLARVFVAPVVWLIVSFAESSYYVCAKLGPTPTNQTEKEAEDFKDMMAKTKRESQLIAWGVFIGMVAVICVVICLENACGGNKKRKTNPDTRVAIKELKASTKLDNDHSASKARLHALEAWVPLQTDTEPWLQVDIGNAVKVSKIATQGSYVAGDACFVKKYILLFSINGTDFQEYREDNNIKVFEGNSDGHTVKTNCLAQPTCARYWKVKPQEWNEKLALRVELFGECPA